MRAHSVVSHVLGHTRVMGAGRRWWHLVVGVFGVVVFNYA